MHGTKNIKYRIEVGKASWYLLNFGSTKPTATPWKIGDSVTVWIVVKP
jgi:hypothetical protein